MHQKEYILSHGGFSVGDYVETTKDPYCLRLNQRLEVIGTGFSGKITSIFRTHYKDFNNDVFLCIEAENYGQRVGGFLMWKRGDKHYAKTSWVTKLD